MQRGHWSCTGLYHALRCPLVRLFGCVSAGVGDDVHLKSLVDRREGRANDPDGGPQSGIPSVPSDAVDLLVAASSRLFMLVRSETHGREYVRDLVDVGPERFLSATVVGIVDTSKTWAAWAMRAALFERDRVE